MEIHRTYGFLLFWVVGRRVLEALLLVYFFGVLSHGLIRFRHLPNTLAMCLVPEIDLSKHQYYCMDPIFFVRHELVNHLL